MARNKELAKKFKGQKCIVCNQPGEGDHIKHFAGDSRKDVEDNIWCLCREHHVLKHTIGLNSFVRRYGLQEELLRRGFEWDDFYDGWMKKF